MPAVQPAEATQQAGNGRLQGLNAIAIVIAALYLGRELLIPMVLAVLLAFVLAPIVMLLQRARLGRAMSVIAAVLLAFLAIAGIGLVVAFQVTDLAAKLPQYQAIVQQKVRSLAAGSELIERMATSAQAMLTGAVAAPHATDAPAVAVAAPSSTPSSAPSSTPSTLALARTVLEPLLSPVATLGITLVFVIFVLQFRADLRDRLVRLLGRQDLHRTILALNDAAGRLSRYFLVQLGLNLGFGAYVTAGLWAAGLPNPLLWGILAGLMRFVPFIGSVIAIVPPVLVALAVSPGWILALVVLAVVLGGDLVMGQVIEPLTFGHSTGLSPIAVIVSTAFWAFMWGPVGLLIATPLTVCLVVGGRHIQALSFLHVLLSDASPLAPAETFYQRALEADQPALLAQARADVARSSLPDYFDRVALPALALVQLDLARDALAFDRLEAIHTQVAAMLARLEASGTPVPGAAPPPGDWQRDGAVLCIPGRGALDDLAATMMAKSLAAERYGVRLVPHAELGSPGLGDGAVRFCCISALEEGSSASSIRFIIRRLQRRLPDAAIVVCFWQATGESATLATLRSEGRTEFIVLSLGELVALTRVVASRGARQLASAQGPEEADEGNPGADDQQR